MPSDQDPTKYVTFSLMASSDRGLVTETKALANKTIYEVIEDNKTPLNTANEYIIKKLKEHIKKYGTINELVIFGHGSGESQTSEPDNNNVVTNRIDTKYLLDRINDIEKELGKKITNRIVFSGCSTFDKLTNKEIRFYREYADKHDMEVVGTTSAGWGNAVSIVARAIQFTPKGEVIRDKSDNRFNPLSLVDEDRTWIDYHLGHTQKEAEIAIERDIINEATALMNFKNTPLSSDYEFNNDKNGVEENFRKQLRIKDRMTDKIDVLLTKDEKGAVMISSDGMVRTRGHVKLHKLTESEKAGKIKELIDYIENLDGPISENKNSIESADEGFNFDIELQGNKSPHFAAVILDNNKGVILATESGGYEVISPRPTGTPVNKTGQNQKPSPKSKNK